MRGTACALRPTVRTRACGVNRDRGTSTMTAAKRTSARKSAAKKSAAKKTAKKTATKTSAAKKSATKTFAKGEHVAWTTPQGETHGTVERKLTRPTRIKGHTVAASPEHPEYLVTSDASGKQAAHLPSGLRKRAR
jgi:Hypervirulence associated proteins TUDOR domain